MTNAITTLGIITTVLSILIYMPQVYKGWVTKDVSSLSRPTFTMVFIGSLLWMIYGAYTGATAAMLTNVGIGILMVPLIYLLFIDNKIIFFTLVATLIAVTVVSIIMWAVGFDQNVALNYTFVILAGPLTSISFVPQVYNVFKKKDVHAISIITMISLSIAQMFWAAYWDLNIIDAGVGSHWIALTWTLITLVCGTAISTGYFLYNKK